MTRPVPEIPGVITATEMVETAEAIAGLQLPSGMIPWFEGGHCDPWNHVETAMALDVGGLHIESRRAYEWLADTQRPDGSWFNYYAVDAGELVVTDAKLDTNVCAYVGTGVWHHWLSTTDHASARDLFPMVERAVDWVLTNQRDDGSILWAREVDDRPWDYALVTGSSSIWHAVHCAMKLARVVESPRPDWEAAAARLGRSVRRGGGPFEPKDRWAMDWYYPVLTGTLGGEAAKARLSEQWDTFVIEGEGVRCVSDEPWVTAAETAECSIAHTAIGDRDTAIDLLNWTRDHRHHDGSYWTGIVYPDEVNFPDEERTAYTAAAVVLAADAITGATPASGVFLAGEE